MLAGTTSVALSVLAVTLTARTVQADVKLATATVPIAAPATNATPASLAPQESPVERRRDALHGIATWYGKVFHGRKTASGERFNMYALTACHPTLPFGSIVRVVNLDNQKSVVVRITDRGYLDEGRIIDLSFAAAQRLSMVKGGLANVDIHILSLPHPPADR